MDRFHVGFGAVYMDTGTQKLKKQLAPTTVWGVFNQPTGLMVELAEKLVAQIDFANWAVFAKTVQISQPGQ